MFTYVDGLLKYKDASGQWHEADVIKGESAYQAAVRLGIFSGTESEYYNKITNDRDSALSQINTKLTEVLSAIDTKKQETLADIPSDYTTLSNDVSNLKSAMYNGANVPTDTFYDGKRVYRDSSGKFWCWGSTNSLARVFIVNPGSKYTISRASGDVIYGFSTVKQGNVELFEGNVSSEPVTFIAPEGYTYLYCQDVTASVPDGVCTLMVEQSIAVDVHKLNALEPLKNNYVLHHGKYCSHIGVYKTNNIIIPCQSIFDVERAKRLGFDVMEINVRQTSDGKYVCLHGTNGAFGVYFTDANGGSVSDVLVSSMTLAEIKQNIRFKSIYAKYRTAPNTLQELLYECKKQEIVPLVEYQPEYTDQIQILDGIMGKDNYMLGTYTLDRPTGITAMMASYLSISYPDSVVAKCNRSGGAYMAGINATNAVYDSYTENDWKTLVNKVHEAGYLISSAYLNEQKTQMFLNCGFDMINTARNINAIKNGNLCNLIGEMTFSDFNTDGTVVDGVLTLASGNTIEPMDSIPNVFLGGSTLRIRFDGTISLNMGANLTGSFSSDGTTEMIFSTFCEDAVPTFTISAETETHIYSLSYKASKL